MEKIFDHANDKNVASYVFYAKAADSKLYYEQAYTTQVSQVDLTDAYNKGRVIIVTATGRFTAVSLAANVVKTIDIVATAVTLVSWAALATVAG